MSYIGCLPFTWENKSVHRLGKWYTNLRTAKSRSESRLRFVKISSIPCTEKRPRRPETGIKDILKKWNIIISLLCSRIFLKRFLNDKQPSRPLMVLNSGY